MHWDAVRYQSLGERRMESEKWQVASDKFAGKRPQAA
jgi:hypothetical protein